MEITPCDKNRIPMCVGDVLKVYHFTAALRRKKYYMYKRIKRKINGYFEISHLSLSGTYMIPLDGKQLSDYEIVQGYAECKLASFEDRPKRPKEPSNG